MARSQQVPSVSQDRSPSSSALPRPSRLRRPDPPNKAAFVEHLKGLEHQIDCLQGRIVEIKSLLDHKLQNRNAASPEVLAARNRLSELSDLFKQALDTKKIHREELDVVKGRLRVDGRSGLPYVNVDEIDEEIQELEYKQTHTTLRIDEEKKLLQQIARLKKSKEALISHESRTEHVLETRNRLMECIKEDDERINGLKAQQEEQRRVLAEIHKRQASIAIDVPALLQEKNSSYGKIKALREEIKQLKADFSLKEDEYWRKEREWRAQDAEDRKAKAEKIRAERLEREKIWKQRALENFVEPYTDEIILCDQLILYLQKIAPAEESLSEPQQKPEALVPAGFGNILISKKDRNENDLEGWFAGSAGMKNKKSKASVSHKSKPREKLSLSIDALTSFEKVKVAAPTTYSDVIKKIEGLQKQKEKYIEMQKQAKEAREKGINTDVLSSEKFQLNDNAATGHSSDKQDSLNHNENDDLNISIFNTDEKKDEHFPKLIGNAGDVITTPEISDNGSESLALLNGDQEESCEALENAIETSLPASESDQGQITDHTLEVHEGTKAIPTPADCGSVDEEGACFSDINDATVTEKEVESDAENCDRDFEVSKLTLEATTSN